MANTPKRIVLTGGPCAGKTTIAQVLEKAFGEKLVVLPESASLLFRGGFPRWAEPSAGAALQRAIYRVQVELEQSFAAHHPGRLLVMDRGTIDGAAYWPAGPVDFFREMHTELKSEIGRYDVVIYLESAGKEAYDENRRRNPARTESWEEAARLDRTTRQQWEMHPNFVVIHNNSAFSAKISSVLAIIEENLKR